MENAMPLPIQIGCSELYQAYKNMSSRIQTITISIDNQCGGHTNLEKTDAGGTSVPNSRHTLPVGGGTVTYDVASGEEVVIFCDGPDKTKCLVEVSI
jgi:hypothetical protein